MRHPTRVTPLSRIAAAVLIAALLSPASGSAAEGEERSPDDEEQAEQSAPAPVEQHWYDAPLRNANITVDLALIRPLAAVTLAAGAALFVPAAIMTAPNGWDSVKEAYGRFVREPAEYFSTRPLGEF